MILRIIFTLIKMSAYSKKFEQNLTLLREKVFTVSEILDFLNDLIKPCQVTVKGEVGEKVREYPRYIFFNLVDKKGAILPCFSFRSVLDDMELILKPGMKVKIFGYPEIRKNKGNFNFQVKKIRPVGKGDLKKQFEILKQRLTKAGYFDPIKKKNISPFLSKIGLITSKGSDAEMDFFTHLEDYGFEVKVYNSKVEGDLALDELLQGIKIFNENFPALEAIVITRGGGSWESLQSFNSKELVKAVFSSKIPIISGVGHENDITLLDLVADKRVSTPTDAGKFLSKEWREAEQYITESEKNLSGATKRIIFEAEQRFRRYYRFFTDKMSWILQHASAFLDYLLGSLTTQVQNKIDRFFILEGEFKSHGYKIEFQMKNTIAKINNLSENLEKNKIRWAKAIHARLLQEEKKIILSSPKLKLRQGYSITRKKGVIVKSVNDLNKGDIITTDLKNGVAESRVQNNE